MHDFAADAAAGLRIADQTSLPALDVAIGRPAPKDGKTGRCPAFLPIPGSICAPCFPEFPATPTWRGTEGVTA
ncbi:MAG: hypothetical protein HY778_02755 [Betaproteobacteria bacterium]|nr:hypothetical protein [Betaproteobacteria bacterium]